MTADSLRDAWPAVDAYFNALLVPDDPVFAGALAASAAAGARTSPARAWPT